MNIEVNLKEILLIAEQLSLQNTNENITFLKKIKQTLENEGYKKESLFVTDLMGNKSYSFANFVSFSNKNDEKDLHYLKLENLFLEEKEKIIKKNHLFNKINDLINNDEITFQFKGFKILLEGKPGTGKTTLIKNLAEINNKNIYSINASSIVSSKLGQTQKNIENLFEEIKKIFIKNIIMIDEFDSLIGSRDLDINNEYHRMIGTFNQALDSLPYGSILIAISNKIDSIDKSTIRRFNLKITMNEIEIEKMVEILKEEADKFKLEFNQEIAWKLLNIKKDELNYSFVEEVVLNSMLEGENINYTLMKLLNLTNEDLLEKGITLRELENLTGTSKSTLQRNNKKGNR